jgi:DnaJ-class molecular chaperone
VLTDRGWGILIAFAAAGVVVWAWRAKYRPKAPCLRCRGSKRVGTSKRWRDRKCKRCGGTGERMVLGAGLFNGGRGWGK